MDKWHWVRHGREWRLEDQDGKSVLRSTGHEVYAECYNCQQEIRGGHPETWLLNSDGDLDPESADARLIALAPEMIQLIVRAVAIMKLAGKDSVWKDFEVLESDMIALMERAHGRAT